jgi:hypothetical protein
MSNERLQPIDPDLDALLEAERAARPPAAALDRVWARVGAVSRAGNARGGGDRDTADDHVEAAGAPHSNGWIASHVGHVAVAAFVLGGAVGAGLQAGLRKPPAEHIVYVNGPARTSPLAAAQPPVELSPVTPPSSAQLVTPPHPSASASASSSLSAERLLLDGARVALTSGEPARALSLLSDHARRFPRPKLGEEREALAIQALVAVGRYDDARARAASFRAAAPHSLFLPAVDVTLASIP